MKLATLTLAAGLLAGGAAQAQDQDHDQDVESLLQTHDCRLCHADRETKTGPAYVDVADKYHGNPDAESSLVNVIRKGARGAGPWHMPPHPEVSPAEAKRIAEYILSLKR
jgi:cytochrome c